MKVRKVIALFITIVMMVSIVTGCSRPSEKSDSAANDEVISIKFAHTDTEQRTSHIAAVHFAEYMDENTNGKVKVEIYPNAQLGDDQEILKGIQLNTIQLWYGSTAAVSAIIGPEGDLFNLPFVYKDYDNMVKAILDDGGLDLYNGILGKTGYVCLGLEYDGSRGILNNKKQINTLEDLKGIKLRSTPSDVLIRTLQLMGANPTPMAWSEVYTGLQQGSVDGLDQSPLLICDQKLYEVGKYYTVTNQLIQSAAVITSQKFMDSLPDDIKATFIEGMDIMTKEQREAEYALSEQNLQEMQDNGVTVNTLSDSEREKFIQAVAPIYDEYREKIGSDVIDQVLKSAADTVTQ